MAQAPPILIYTPGGGVSVPIGSNPPVYTQAGTTVLVENQDYLDVVFGSIQTDDEWVLGECVVVNETDVDPLNLWPGIITDKTAAGFRIYFNGMPDSGNYYLHWAVSGVNIEPSEAMTYILSGPSSVTGDEVATYTVSLPPSTFVDAPVTVTPAEGGLEIGVFSPETVTLTTDSPSASFTFTPSLYGATTITVNNDRGLTDPDDLALTVVEPIYTLEGPSGGDSGVESSDFTVELVGAVIGTVTVTPSSGGGGGTFTPTTVELTTLAPSDTFTYTPASGGAKTISVTNDAGLTDPASLTYTAVAPGLSTWSDSSSSGNDATQSGSARPVVVTNVLNSLPVVRFTSANATLMNLTTPISGSEPWVAFAVMKPATGGSSLLSLGIGTTNMPIAFLEHSDGNLYSGSRTQYGNIANSWTAAFHVFTSKPQASAMYVDGTLIFPSMTPNVVATNFSTIGEPGSNGDIAEIIFYNVTLSDADRSNIEKYLGTKYAITVAGGSAVQPDTVSGLVGWWKADAT